jgi:hypothetical protein
MRNGRVKTKGSRLKLAVQVACARQRLAAHALQRSLRCRGRGRG